MTTARYEYDASGRLTSRTGTDGGRTSFEYDKQGSPTRIRTPDNEVRYSYDVQGNRTEMRDKTGLTRYKYDAFNRLVEVTTKHSPEMILRYDYDPWGRVTTVAVAGNKKTEYQVRYEYDMSGNITSVDDGQNRIVYSYLPGRGEVTRVLPNGIKTVYSYSANGALAKLRHLSSDGRLIASYRYEYDPEGRVTLLSQQTPGRTQVTRLEWAGDGQLAALHLPNGEVTRYSYDALGDRLAMRGANGSAEYQYDGFGRLTKAGDTTYEWDREGNLARQQDPSGGIVFEYDSRDLPTLVETPKQRVELGWDGDGSLVSQRSGGASSHFLSDPLAPPGSILAEYDDTGKIGATYLFGNTLIGERNSNGACRFFLEDGFGSVRQTVDARGVIVVAQDYSALADLETKAMQDVVGALGGTVRELEFALTGIPFVRQYGTAATIFSYVRALWFMNHSRGSLPKWLTGPDGPDALRGTPAGHLVLAWDLVKGPMNLPFRSSTTPVDRLYDDGALKIQTWGVQTIQQYYSSNAPDWPGLRDYGYDPLTDTLSTTVHTMIRTTETSGLSWSDWASQSSRTTSANTQKKDELEEALRRYFIEGLERLVETREKRWLDNSGGGDPPDLPPPPPLAAAVNPFEVAGSFRDPLRDPGPTDTVQDRAQSLTTLLGDPAGGLQGPPYLDGGIDLSVEPEYLPDASLADLEKAVESALAKPGAGPSFDVEFQGKHYEGVVLPLTEAGKAAWNEQEGSNDASAVLLNADGRPAKARDGRGNDVELAYDNTGELSSASLRAGTGWRAKAERVNGRSEVTFVNKLGHTFVRRYDPSGFLSELTIDGRPYAVVSYDPGRRAAIIRYEGFEERIAYGVDGRIERYEVRPLRDDGKAAEQPRLLRFQYDGQGRMTRISGDRQLSLAYRHGRLQTVQTGRNRVRFASDPQTGRPRKLETSWGLSLQFGYAGDSLRKASVQYGEHSAKSSYADGRLVQTQGFSGERSTYAYTATGYLGSMTDSQGRTTSFAYDNDSRLREVRLPDGRRIEYSYTAGANGAISVGVAAYGRP